MERILAFAVGGNLVDANTFIVGNVDATKKLTFQVDTQATASTLTIDVGAQTASRTLLVPVLAGTDTLMTLAVNQTVTGILTLGTPLASTSGGTGVNNAGTLTNATNTTITGGGTLALAGFTLTVPATGTAALLGVANTFTLVNTFSNATSATTSQTGAIVQNSGSAATSVGIGQGNINAGGIIRASAASGAARLQVDSVDSSSSRVSNSVYLKGGIGIDESIAVGGAASGICMTMNANLALFRCNSTGATDTGYIDFARIHFRDQSNGLVDMLWIDNGVVTVKPTTGTTFVVSSTTDASAVGTAAVVLSGGLGVAKRSYLGTISATFKGNVNAGVQDATAAVAGQVGEVISSSVTAAAVAATGTAGNVTSISLTAGDWLISGNVVITGGATGLTSGSTAKMSIVTTSATNGTSGSTMAQESVLALLANGLFEMSLAHIRVNTSATATYYLTEEVSFVAGSPTVAGTLIATRMR